MPGHPANASSHLDSGPQNAPWREIAEEIGPTPGGMETVAFLPGPPRSACDVHATHSANRRGLVPIVVGSDSRVLLPEPDPGEMPVRTGSRILLVVEPEAPPPTGLPTSTTGSGRILLPGHGREWVAEHSFVRIGSSREPSER